MKVETFMTMLFVVSVFTSLFTEGIKKVFIKLEKKWNGTVLAGIVALVLGSFMCYAYTMFAGAVVNELLIITYIAFVALSWLCATVGYDKVVQAVKQVIGSGKA